MTQEQMRNLNTIVETYGNDAQEDMAIEECSELIKAITQLGIVFNCVAEVEDRIDFKINRQMGRIKEREAKRDVC